MKPVNKLGGHLCSVCRTIISSEPGYNLMCPKCQEKAITMLKSVIHYCNLPEEEITDGEVIDFINELKISEFLIELIYD